MANLIDLNGVTTLFLASYQGDINLVNLLISYGARPEQNKKRATALHICAERGFVEIAASLLSAFPWLVYECDETGNLALHVACDWD